MMAERENQERQAPGGERVLPLASGGVALLTCAPHPSGRGTTIGVPKATHSPIPFPLELLFVCLFCHLVSLL